MKFLKWQLIEKIDGGLPCRERAKWACGILEKHSAYDLGSLTGLSEHGEYAVLSKYANGMSIKVLADRCSASENRIELRIYSACTKAMRLAREGT